MGFLERLDGLLTKVASAFESIPRWLSRAADYVLELISRYTHLVLDVIRLAVETIYRFFRQMLINSLKIGWHLGKLAVILLVFAYAASFGWELITAKSAFIYQLVGWILLASGSISILLTFVALLASLPRRPVFLYGTGNGAQPEQPRKAKYFAFFLLDLLAIGTVVGWTRLYV
ncbi:MAG: hypothetical protein WBF13_10745, partial [Candidatus Zixiibacteriota bacterium]